MTTLKMTKTKDRPLSSGDKLRSVDLRVTLVFAKPWDVAEQGDSAHYTCYFAANGLTNPDVF